METVNLTGKSLVRFLRSNKLERTAPKLLTICQANFPVLQVTDKHLVLKTV